MAACAKEKAYNHKDSYVAGLIEGGATAPAPAMPTQDMGEQASMLVDVDKGSVTLSNDNDPTTYARGGGRTVSAPFDLMYGLDKEMYDNAGLSKEAARKRNANPLTQFPPGGRDTFEATPNAIHDARQLLKYLQ